MEAVTDCSGTSRYVVVNLPICFTQGFRLENLSATAMTDNACSFCLYKWASLHLVIPHVKWIDGWKLLQASLPNMGPKASSSAAHTGPHGFRLSTHVHNNQFLLFPTAFTIPMKWKNKEALNDVRNKIMWTAQKDSLWIVFSKTWQYSLPNTSAPTSNSLQKKVKKYPSLVDHIWCVNELWMPHAVLDLFSHHPSQLERYLCLKNYLDAEEPREWAPRFQSAL